MSLFPKKKKVEYPFKQFVTTNPQKKGVSTQKGKNRCQDIRHFGLNASI